MNARTKWNVLPAALLMMGSMAMAQSQSAGAAPTNAQNAQNQQDRSAQGAQGGQWVSSGASNLASDESDIYEGAAAGRSATGDNAALIARTGVNEAFENLSHAFASKDLNSVKQVWPTIPGRPSAALQKSFGYFRSVSRNFTPESIDVTGDTATVIGSYSGAFVKGPTTIPSIGQFHATLRRAGTRWVIDTLICN